MHGESRSNDSITKHSMSPGHSNELAVDSKGTGKGVIGGPGRKSKACKFVELLGRPIADKEIAGLECKKLKMKCEVFPGDRKCKHCLRRKAECIFRPSFTVQVDDEGTLIGVTERYE